MCFREINKLNGIGTRTNYVDATSSLLSLEWLVFHFPYVLGFQHLGFLHDLSKAIRYISYQQLILISHVRN